MTNVLAPDALIHNRYRVVRAIGRGGMGAVYEAVDTRLGNTVALKQTLVSGEQLEEAFAREARLLASLRHAALPVVSDYFAEDDGRFLVMQYIPGDDFASILARRTAPFAFEDVIRWADQLLDALDYLHTQTPPVIHRDIKPQNLKLTPRGEIVLLDFGLAKSAAPTRAGASVFGYTPQYAPLEQIQGTGTDPRSDLYSLGAMLYHMLTNTLPANALERATAALSNQPDPLRPLSELSPSTPAGVAAVIQQSLMLDAAARPRSAATMRAALTAALRSGSAGAATTPMETEVYARPAAETPVTPVAPAPGRSRAVLWLVLAAGAIGLALICALAGGFALYQRAQATLAPTAAPAPRPTIEEIDPPPTIPPLPTLEPIVITIPTIDIPTIVIPTIDLPGNGDQPSGGFARAILTFGEEGSGPGRFDDPRGIALDSDGHIFISDYVTGRVQKFDSSGKFLLSWISEGDTPILALAADLQGNIFVSRASSVQQYDGASGELLASFDISGDGFDELITLPNRTMLGIPWAEEDILLLDAEGNETARREAPLAQAGADEGPMQLAADALGNLYILGDSGANVFRFDAEGRFVDRFEAPNGWGFSDIALDGAGRIYVSTLSDGINVFDDAGRQIGVIPVAGVTRSMVFDPAGRMYVVTGQAQVIVYEINEP